MAVNNERNFPLVDESNFGLVAASSFGLGYQNGKPRFDAERNYPPSDRHNCAGCTGLKIRLSDPVRTFPTSWEDILQVIYWQEIRLLKGDCKSPLTNVGKSEVGNLSN